MSGLKARIIFCVIGFCCFSFVSGCAPTRPVLYPNAKYKEVGEAQANADIDACIEMAKTHGVKDKSGEKAVADTAKSAAVGAAAGAASAAVWGGNVGRSAGAWAAGAAAATAVYKVAGSGEHDPVFRGFVDQCLREKGYQPAGWQ